MEGRNQAGQASSRHSRRLREPNLLLLLRLDACAELGQGVPVSGSTRQQFWPVQVGSLRQVRQFRPVFEVRILRST